MMVTQKNFEGLGTESEPHRNTITGRGSERIEADLTWCRNTMQ
jgi:hypothetical protein